MLKIRLRRTGAKFQPTYRVVVADSRAPRDGAFVSILGFYNPRTDPPTITINEDAMREWIRKGAQPTDSVLSLLQTAHMAPDLLERFRTRVRGAKGVYGTRQGTAAPTDSTPDAPPAPPRVTAPAAVSAAVAPALPLDTAPATAVDTTPDVAADTTPDTTADTALETTTATDEG